MGKETTVFNVEDLGGPVATGSDVLAIMAETDAAHNALMRKVVDQVNIEHTAHTVVENGEPVGTLALEVSGYCVRFDVREHLDGRGNLLAVSQLPVYFYLRN